MDMPKPSTIHRGGLAGHGAGRGPSDLFGLFALLGLFGLRAHWLWVLMWLSPPAHGRELSAPVPEPPAVVRLVGGQLSVNVRDARLVDVLDELSRQGGFGLAPCAACEQRISLRFDRLPLGEGLALILRDQNFALRWQAAVGTAGVPRQLWLLPQVQQQRSNQAPNQSTNHVSNPGTSAPAAPARPLAAVVDAAPLAARPPSALIVGTPQERAEAAAALARRRPPDAVASLARALADSDRQVRHAAIESLAEIGGAQAVGALALALRDGDARLREAAVNALGDLGGAKAIALLRQAQQDSSPFVRQAASETLADLLAKQR